MGGIVGGGGGAGVMGMAGFMTPDHKIIIK